MTDDSFPPDDPTPQIDPDAQAEYDASPELRALLRQARASKVVHQRRSRVPVPGSVRKWDDRPWLARTVFLGVVLAMLAGALAVISGSLVLAAVGALYAILAITCFLRLRVLLAAGPLSPGDPDQI